MNPVDFSSRKNAVLSNAELCSQTKMEVKGAFHETRYGWLVLALVWLAGVAYMAACLKLSFWPLDGGAFGAMAARVLHGQVPHRDYGEIYTGGLT